MSAVLTLVVAQFVACSAATATPAAATPPAAPPTPRRTGRPPRRRRERQLPGVGRGRRQHRHPLVQRVHRPAVAPGRPRAPPADLPGRADLGGGLRHGVPDPGVRQRHRPGRPSTPPPPAPAARRRSTSPAPAATSGCTAPPAPPRTATRCGSSPCTRPAGDHADRRHRRRPPPDRRLLGRHQHHPGRAERARRSRSSTGPTASTPTARSTGASTARRTPSPSSRTSTCRPTRPGRMYFYLGSPNSQYFDFIEFTVGAVGVQRQHHPGRRASA